MANSTALQLSADELLKMGFNKNFVIEFLSLTQNQLGPSGFAVIPLGDASVVVTAPVNAESNILLSIASNDSTMKNVSYVATSGSFEIFADVAPTADVRVVYQIL